MASLQMVFWVEMREISARWTQDCVLAVITALLSYLLLSFIDMRLPSWLLALFLCMWSDPFSFFTSNSPLVTIQQPLTQGLPEGWLLWARTSEELVMPCFPRREETVASAVVRWGRLRKHSGFVEERVVGGLNRNVCIVRQTPTSFSSFIRDVIFEVVTFYTSVLPL